MDVLDFPESGRFEALVAYWQRLRDDVSAGAVPSRTTLNPVAIKELLPFIFLVERLAEDDLHVRLSGTALDAISHEPMTGRNYLKLCPPHIRDLVMQSATAVCAHPCGHRYKRRVTRPDGDVFEVTTLALPMTDRHGECRYLLGMMSARAELIAPEGPESRESPESKELRIDVLSADFVDLGFGVPDQVLLA